MTVGATASPCPNRIGKAYRYGDAPRGYQVCGITREWCNVDPWKCPVCFGEWGAWRSDGGSTSRAWGAAEDWAARDPWLNLDSAAFIIGRSFGWGLLAAGWSP